MAGPCVADTACIELNVNTSGALTAAPILSPDAENALECRANGMYAPRALQAIGCTSVGEANLFALPNGTSLTGIQAGSLSIVNPSATRTMVVWSTVLFGTADIILNANADMTVTYRCGYNQPLADAGYIFEQDNSGAGSRRAYPPVHFTNMSCPTPIAAGGAYTLTWEIEIDVATGLSACTLRTVFAQLWGVVT